MNLLDQCSFSRLVDFLNIPNDASPTDLSEDQDLFVGIGKQVTITFPNGITAKFRDLVILGTLTLQSSDPSNLALKPSIIARDIFAPGKFNLDNLKLQCRNQWIPKNIAHFHSKLEESLLERISVQKESVNKIGLRSILL